MEVQHLVLFCDHLGVPCAHSRLESLHHDITKMSCSLLLRIFYHAVSRFATMHFRPDATELEMTSNDQHVYSTIYLQHVAQYDMAHQSRAVLFSQVSTFRDACIMLLCSIEYFSNPTVTVSTARIIMDVSTHVYACCIPAKDAHGKINPLQLRYSLQLPHTPPKQTCQRKLILITNRYNLQQPQASMQHFPDLLQLHQAVQTRQLGAKLL